MIRALLVAAVPLAVLVVCYCPDIAIRLFHGPRSQRPDWMWASQECIRVEKIAGSYAVVTNESLYVDVNQTAPPRCFRSSTVRRLVAVPPDTKVSIGDRFMRGPFGDFDHPVRL